MAASLDSPPPSSALINDGRSLMGSSPLCSPSSDKRFWSALRSRIDTVLENRSCRASSDQALPNHISVGGPEGAKRLKEDSMLLLRGFDSISQTLSQLSDNIDNALQGARDLGKPPTLTDIFHSNLREADGNNKEVKVPAEEEEQNKQGSKRKFESSNCLEDQEDSASKEVALSPKNGKLKRAKNLAISIAAKASSLTRELKAVKSDLSFVQERCSLLEEENRRLRDGFSKGIRPEEDDLVRLQLETLLAEKSRLANENANLIRENQCLNQLVTYHQMNSQDLSDSYEQVIQGLCLDFSSPPQPISEEPEEDLLFDGTDDRDLGAAPVDVFSISASLDRRFEEEEEEKES